MATLSNSSLDGSRTADIVGIKQTLNLFAVLTDRQQFSQYSQVFTENATADFGIGQGIQSGIPEITNLISSTLKGVRGQHSYSTQFIDITGLNTANSTTYFVGIFFGQGYLEGQIFQNFGIYEAELEKNLQGWKISRLQQITEGQTGNRSVVFPS
ncbi:MAG: hypothetical protein M1820_000834 [Bogoriella megaspora]|nr:MAG: hypothetical protein M1820_000834 [Bogoriella megaspora]